MAKLKKPLTVPFITSLKASPPGTRVLHYDALVPGLALSVTDKGAKTFVLERRYPSTGKPARRALGKAGRMTLASARAKASRWNELIDLGIDPSDEERRLTRLRDMQRTNTFEAVAGEFVRQALIGQRKAADVEREINRVLVPRWGGRPIAEITLDDILELCADFRRRGTIHDGHNIFGHVRRLFRWAIHRQSYGLSRSPCEGLSPAVLIGKKVVRQRELSNDEICAFGAAARGLDFPFGPMFQMLMLTGGRISEVTGVRWREIDLDHRLWTVPAERFKAGRTHLVPLSEDLAALLQSLPRFGGGDYIFTTSGGSKPVGGISKAKARLDDRMKEMLAVSAARRGGVLEWEDFRNHDIRRTVRTRLSELRVQPIVAELVIGHALPGLLKVYDRFQYLDERREALEAWAMRLRNLQSAPSGGGILTMVTAS